MNKPLLSGLSCFLALICGLHASAAVGDTFEYNGIYYTILDENAKTVETKQGSYTNRGHIPGNNVSGTLNLPETVSYNGSDYTLTKIGDYSFYNCKELTGDLVIPNSVKEIGSGALCDCSGFNGSLSIGNSVTEIGSSAFWGCNGFNGSLTIPNSVTYIGNEAFYCCTGFTGSLTIPNYVTEIGDSAFYGCRGFNGSLTIPNSVTQIGSYAFSGCCGFTGSLIIPNSVTDIGNNAFSYCSGFTGSLTIGDSVTEIGKSAFYQCEGFTGSLVIPNFVTEIGEEAFFQCSGFTGSLIIPNSVTEIGSSAFWGCNGFNGSLTIPNSVTKISHGAFSSCSGFTGSLTIPNSVTEIGHGAFSGCRGFTGSLTIPNSVSSIGYGPFANCSGLTEIKVEEENTNYRSIDGILFNKTATELIQYPAGKQCHNYSIPNSVTKIGAEAFFSCGGFTGSLIIPNSVTEIGDYAFAGCSGLENIFLPANVETIYDTTFEACKKANLVTLNKSLSVINDGYSSGTRHPTYYALGETVDNLKAAIDDVRVNPFLDPIFNDEIGKQISIARNSELTIKPVAHAFGPATGLQFDMTLPEGLTLTDVNAVGVQAAFAKQTNGDYRVLIFSWTGQALGDLQLGFTFSADESLNDGELKVHDVIHSIFGQAVLGDDETVPVTVLVGNGDANGDGIVNIADVTAIMNNILGNVSEDFNFELADVNRDGKINIVDLTEVVNKILAQPMSETEASAKIVARIAAQNNEINFGQAESLGDNRYRVPLLLSSAIEYAGIQMDIIYPDDVEIEEITLGPSIESTHVLFQSDVTETAKRILIFSMTLKPLPTEPNSVLVNLIVKGNSSNDVIRINKVAASDINNHSFDLNDTETTMGAVTGIENVTIDGIDGYRKGIFDLYGRMYDDVDNLAPGIYVIDGIKQLIK